MAADRQTYTQLPQCNHASVGLAQARPNYKLCSQFLMRTKHHIEASLHEHYHTQFMQQCHKHICLLFSAFTKLHSTTKNKTVSENTRVQNDNLSFTGGVINGDKDRRTTYKGDIHV